MVTITVTTMLMLEDIFKDKSLWLIWRSLVTSTGVAESQSQGILEPHYFFTLLSDPYQSFENITYIINKMPKLVAKILATSFVPLFFLIF